MLPMAPVGVYCPFHHHAVAQRVGEIFLLMLKRSSLVERGLDKVFDPALPSDTDATGK